MRGLLALLLLLSACAQGPQSETSEATLANQAKAIEKAADAAVNRSIADIATENAAALDQVDPINASKSDAPAKPILASAKPTELMKKK
jgi:curli biogenesis system outer membrane secretion channel CsgG